MSLTISDLRLVVLEMLGVVGFFDLNMLLSDCWVLRFLADVYFCTLRLSFFSGRSRLVLNDCDSGLFD